VYAAVYYGPRDLRLEAVPEPEPGPGEVKLRVFFNGICGSDLHEYYDGPITTRTTPHPLTGVKNPVILGHELSGEVVSCGAGIHDLARGDYPLDEWVETIPFQNLVEGGLERLHRQEGLKILVDVRATRRDGAAGQWDSPVRSFI